MLLLVWIYFTNDDTAQRLFYVALGFGNECNRLYTIEINQKACTRNRAGIRHLMQRFRWQFLKRRTYNRHWHTQRSEYIVCPEIKMNHIHNLPNFQKELKICGCFQNYFRFKLWSLARSANHYFWCFKTIPSTLINYVQFCEDIMIKSWVMTRYFYITCLYLEVYICTVQYNTTLSTRLSISCTQ